jgi:hypothetical protein
MPQGKLNSADLGLVTRLGLEADQRLGKRTRPHLGDVVARRISSRRTAVRSGYRSSLADDRLGSSFPPHGTRHRRSTSSAAQRGD